VTSVQQSPPPGVLAAFGLVGPAERLAGGQGTSWRVGGVVLKPGVDPQFQEWLGTVVAGIAQRGFRLPTVRRAEDREWVVQGWGAQSFLPGSTVREGVTDWGSIIGASRACTQRLPSWHDQGSWTGATTRGLRPTGMPGPKPLNALHPGSAGSSRICMRYRLRPDVPSWFTGT
jgi:hypothetical protein